jgi:hypothetical protein
MPSLEICLCPRDSIHLVGDSCILRHLQSILACKILNVDAVIIRSTMEVL